MTGMPGYNGPKLAVVIPTYRFDSLARDILVQAAAMGCADILVHIADNSENPEKHTFLEGLAARGENVVITCHDKNIGPEANWHFLVKAQTAPYICIAADDDSYGGAYFRAGLQIVLDDPGCSAASGLHLSIAHRADSDIPAMYSPAERKEADPLDRIRNYSGENAMAYTVSKTVLVQKFADYVGVNPLKCPFNDYMLAFHMLSIGTYRMDRLGYVYMYDNTKWHLNDDFIKANDKLYTVFGLPEGFAYMTRLHWAVVAVHFFSSIFRSPDLADERAEAIASYLFERQRREFQDDFARYWPKICRLFDGHPAAAAACERLIGMPYERITPIFDDFEIVVSVFSPTVAKSYRAFQAATLLPYASSIKTSTPPPEKPIIRVKRRLGLVREPFSRI